MGNSAVHVRQAVCLAIACIAGPIACTTEPPPPQHAATSNTFVGSQSCRDCHESIYDRWATTLMANVVQDPKEHPNAILGDFSTPNPLVTFARDDVAFTYGSKWKQRYWKKQGNDYFVLPAQWDVRNKVWRPYHVQAATDWWVPYYPAEPGDNTTRPTSALCDGCHSVNFNIKTHTATELKVGCERCHGAGGAHSAHPTKSNIVNAARLDNVRSNDVCIQCHSQGQPRANPIEGQYYDWAVGYQPGDRLSDTWKLEDHRLGETTFTHWPDASAHKNRMQGNDYVRSRMYEKGVRCSACHDPHGTGQGALLKFAGNDVCLQCHGPRRQAGPGVTAEAHSHHAVSSVGNQCVACHMPLIATTIADVSVRSHTFNFISPTMTEKYGIPNPCTSCHKDKSTGWATEALNQWSNVSPWRMASQ
jgi:predicted CXXCH cytochrome family protein